jgi:hypothetical protein
MEPIELRAHHVDWFGHYFLIGFKNFELDHDYYGEEFVRFSKELFEELINNPEQKVKIVMGLDPICMHENFFCRRFDEECESDFEDSISEYGYNLEVDKTYTMKELLGKINSFHDKKGYLTPRDEFNQKHAYLSQFD